MPQTSCGPLLYSRFSTVLALAFALVFVPFCVAQQPKVPAPHKPVSPRLTPPQRFGPPLHQSAVGGLWMTDANMKASLYLKNTMKTNPVVVTPSLYLSNGVRYMLSPVTLEPSGTAIVDINQSLAQQGVAPYAKLYGYAEIEYQWPWAPVSATIRNVDSLNSLIFIYSLQQPPDPLSQHDHSASNQSMQKFEGLWWKQEPDVSAFVALANVTGSEINTAVRLSDKQDAQLASYQIAIPPHATKMVNFAELKSAASTAGGIFLAHDGPERGLAINGGLADESVGYSAHLWLFLSPQPPSTTTAQTPSESSFAELGLMSGAADPMMNFPSGTTFTPYSVVRNISDQPVSASPTLWWMAGGTARSAPLPQITVAPHRTVDLNLPALITAAGLKNFNGSVNLILDAKGQTGALAMTSGSVDQKNTYVFEVAPHAVSESASKFLCYWSTGNGDDTMVTLWNPADEQQDLLFTLFFSGGQYAYPIQLAPRTTRMFNISELLRSGFPDTDGNVPPAGVFEGSAEIAGAQGEQQHVLVNMDAGTYNVRKAICGVYCQTCNGVVSNGFLMADNPFAVPVSGTKQQTFYGQWNTGWQQDYTGHSSWGSSNANVATVGTAGLVNGVAAGSVTVSAHDLSSLGEPVFVDPFCASSGTTCPVQYSPGATGGGTSQVPTSLSVISAKAIPPPTTTTAPGCPAGSYGLMADIVYQVLDQNNPPKPIKSTSMRPQEEDLNYVFNGVNQGNPVPNWQDVMGGSSPITAGRTYTDANGTFEDAPFGICASAPFTATFTQPLSILLNGTRYNVRTNNWKVVGTGANKGQVTNGADINVTR